MIASLKAIILTFFQTLVNFWRGNNSKEDFRYENERIVLFLPFRVQAPYQATGRSAYQPRQPHYRDGYMERSPTTSPGPSYMERSPTPSLGPSDVDEDNSDTDYDSDNERRRRRSRSVSVIWQGNVNHNQDQVVPPEPNNRMRWTVHEARDNHRVVELQVYRSTRWYISFILSYCRTKF